MSRDLMDENYYVSHGGKIPVKWTAPEVRRACNIVFTTIHLLHMSGSSLQEVLDC